MQTSKRFFFFSLLALALCLGLSAQTARQELKKNPFLAGGNYLDYNRQLPDFRYTATPAGYTPFYMSHYGRHGSRWLIDERSYTRVIEPLEKAERQGKLTAKGSKTLRDLRVFEPSSHQRLGDLTTVGERQHHGIGKRMTEHFPEIFLAKGVAIDARSTTVNRCILSMVAECEELMGANGTARIHNDVSDALQYYLNQPHSKRLRNLSRRGDEARKAFRMKHNHPERLLAQLFNDPQWAADSIDGGALMMNLFEVAINMQSHDTSIDFLPLFNDDEIYDQWRIRNADWNVGFGASKLSGSEMPFSQSNLLRNIIATADTCVSLGKPQATLRFGHEVCVMPLACLMELGNSAFATGDLNALEYAWQNYKIFPMACNIQLIFYRPIKGEGDILVKALLNEREMKLPVDGALHPYYKWKDLRQYWQQKLDNYDAKA